MSRLFHDTVVFYEVKIWLVEMVLEANTYVFISLYSLPQNPDHDTEKTARLDD